MWTVFFNKESNEPTQDFDSYLEAKDYAIERIEWGFADSYTIQRAL